MPRVRPKKNVKVTKPVPEPEEPHFMDHEIKALEQQVGAIRAVKEVKTEHLLTDLRYLRSCFSEEQLQKTVLEIFEEALPNLSIVNDKESNKFEVIWKDKESMNMNMNGGGVHASLLQRLSMAYPHCSSSIPPFAGAFEYSSNAVGRTSFIGADNPYLKDFVLEEPSETQILATQEGLQTPGVTSQRLSVGMTPKTLRVPKPGEMLLSVHGSPLGVYKDNNMEAIHESEEG
ncbi:translation initiation factor [Trifolium repens]|nr:translation initiation factor [Trifolium repens]